MDSNHIFESFFRWQNPAIFIFILFIILSIIVILIIKDYIKQLKSRTEKLEETNMRLMALFAELDPDPILRIDENGIIIMLNDPAKRIIHQNIVGKRCDTIITNYKELLKRPKINNEIVEINKKYYTISLKENNSLEFVQIYLHDITDRIEQEKQIEEYQENLRLLRIKLNERDEKLKEHIGRELHDNIGNQISILKLSFQNYLENTEINKIDKLYNRIDLLADNVRGISHQLSPNILKEFGLVSALTQLVEETTKNSNMSGHVININYLEMKDINLELGIFRICQEALGNIIKHAKCSEFEIQIIVEEGFLKFIIMDNGVGFTQEKTKKPSLGLLNMEERAKALNGRFEIESSVEGTTIYLEFALTIEEKL
ncbi:MAG: ATP-binding protein [bacterium]